MDCDLRTHCKMYFTLCLSLGKRLKSPSASKAMREKYLKFCYEFPMTGPRLDPDLTELSYKKIEKQSIENPEKGDNDNKCNIER